MINSINGPGDIQSALVPPQTGKGKIKQAKAEVQVDYSVSFQKKTLAAVTYNRSSKIDDRAVDGVTDLRELVTRLLVRQGITWEAAMAGEPVEIDEETRAEAQALIADDGYWGIEQTSARIFELALANAGGDVTKFDEIKEAVSKGFEMAKEALGGMLPEISSKTFDAVMAKLDEWAADA